jgi:hypothetical protein
MKLMQKISTKQFTQTNVTQGVLATLAFFNLYKLPVSSHKVWELLYRTAATLPEVEAELDRLVKLDVIITKDKLFALENWDEKLYATNQQEIEKRWNRIKRFYWALSSVPYVESICVINSVAMGNADTESDIDFFIITKPNRLYFVRTWIILMFKLFGVYKTRDKINKQFCFGFFITSDALSIKHLLLPQEDPYLVYWLATIIPITGEQMYERFIKENRWLYSWFPNFKTLHRAGMVREFQPKKRLKRIFEALFNVCAALTEPLLRRIHIRHTFKLPENHWRTSSTIANKTMLKLHALDPRKDLRQRFWDTLRNYR